MKFLVTGGAGFIGSHVVENLVSRGIPTTVWDDLSSGFRENIAPFLSAIDFIHAPLSDRSVEDRAFEGVTHVIHLAAQISVPGSWQKMSETVETNTRDTVRLLERCRSSKTFEGIAFASSCAVYGNKDQLPVAENESCFPNSPYALSKLSAEAYFDLFAKTYGLPSLVFRFFNVFGPRQRNGSAYASVISQFSTRVLRDELVTIYGDGKQTRDFIYVKDVARFLVEASLKCAVMQGTYNLCRGEEFSVQEILNLIESAAGKSVPKVHLPERVNDIARSLGTHGKFKSACEGNGVGWQLTPVHEAIQESLKWYKQEEEQWVSKFQFSAI